MRVLRHRPGDAFPVRAGAAALLGVLALLAIGHAGGTDPTGGTATAAPAAPLTPGPWSPRTEAGVIQNPTRTAQAVTPFELGAGLTRAEATRGAARILHEEHLDGTVEVDLDGWPNLVRVRSAQPPPGVLSSRLMHELGILMLAYTPRSPQPTT